MKLLTQSITIQWSGAYYNQLISYTLHMSHTPQDEDPQDPEEPEGPGSQQQTPMSNPQPSEKKGLFSNILGKPKPALQTTTNDQQDQFKKERQAKLKELKQQREEVKRQIQSQTNMPKIVQYIMKPPMSQSQIEGQIPAEDPATLQNQSVIVQPTSLKKQSKLAPVVSVQHLKAGMFKRPEDIELAKKVFKGTNLIPLQIVRNPNKNQAILDVLNELTNDDFNKCKSYIQFDKIDERVKKNMQFCLVDFRDVIIPKAQDLRVPNDLALKSNDTLFFWEATHNRKSLCMSTPKPFDNTENETLDFLFAMNVLHPLELILWKKSNHDELYIGQVDINAVDFEGMAMVRNFNPKIVKEKTFSLMSVVRRDPDKQTEIGKVQLRLVQYAEVIAPLNQYSQLPGSPTNPVDRRKQRKIEDSKEGQYKFDQDNSKQIGLIHDATSALLAVEIDSATAATDLGLRKADMLKYEQMLSDPKCKGKKFFVARRLNKQEAAQVAEMLKSLDEGKNAEIYQKLKTLTVQRRITKKDIEQGLKELGCSGTVLLLAKKDELGLSLMDMMLLNDDYGMFIEVLADVELPQANDADIDDLGENLFGNMIKQLRHNDNIEPALEVIKTLNQFPNIGSVIYNYAQNDCNKHGDGCPLLSNLNLENYEHVMVLGKVIKLAQKSLDPQDEWLLQLQSTYKATKKNIYYKVPVLPKKGNLAAKADMLKIEELDQNIFHELTRRKRWNYVHKGLTLPTGGDMFLEKDTSGHSPLMYTFEKAPFDTVMNLTMVLFTDEPVEEKKENEEGVNNEEKKQDEEVKQDGEQGEQPKKVIRGSGTRTSSKKSPEEILMSATTPSGKNVFHSLASNMQSYTGAQQEQLQTIVKIQEVLGEEKSAQLLTQPWGAGDLTPFGLYLDKFVTTQMKTKGKNLDLATTLDILKVLSKPLKTESKPIEQRFRAQTLSMAIKLRKKLPKPEHKLKPRPVGNVNRNPKTERRKAFMFEKGSRSFTALPKNEFFDGMKEDLEKVYLNSSQISRILANLDESLLAEVEKVIGWVDWLSPTSQFPFDTTLGTTGVEYLVRHEHYKKALEVIDKITPATAFETFPDAAADDEIENYLLESQSEMHPLASKILEQIMTEDEHYQVNNASTLIKVLVDAQKGQNKATKPQRDQFIAAVENKLAELVQADPSILVRPLMSDGMAPHYDKKEGPFFETLLNQLNWTNQTNVLATIDPESLAKLKPENVALAFTNAIVTQDRSFFDFKGYPDLVAAMKIDASQLNTEGLLMEILKHGIKSCRRDFNHPGLLKPFASHLLGDLAEATTEFLILMGITQAQIFDYQIENYDKLKGKNLGHMMTVVKPADCQRTLARFVREKKHWPLINFLKAIDPLEVDKNYPPENAIKKSDDTQQICTSIFNRLCETTNSKGVTSAEVPILQLFSAMLDRPQLFRPQAVAAQVPRALLRGDTITAHACLLYLNNPKVLRITGPKGVKPYVTAGMKKEHLPYLLSIQNAHWATALPLETFTQAIKDVSPIMSDDDYSTIAFALSKSAMYDKLKLVLPRIKKKEHLLAMLAQAAFYCAQQQLSGKAIASANYPLALDPLFDHPKLNKRVPFFPEEALRPIREHKEDKFSIGRKDIKRKPEDKHVTNDKLVYTALSKVFLPPAANVFVEKAYKAATFSANRMKTFLAFEGMAEQAIRAQEYQATLRRTFCSQNISSFFATNPLVQTQDYPKTVDMLVDTLQDKSTLTKFKAEPKNQEMLDLIAATIPTIVSNPDKAIPLVQASTLPEVNAMKTIIDIVKLYATNSGYLLADKRITDAFERNITYLRNNFTSNLTDEFKADQKSARMLFFCINRVLQHERGVAPPTVRQRFMTELILIIFDNLSADQINSMDPFVSKDKLPQALALFLVRQKLTDKPVTDAIQKYFSNKTPTLMKFTYKEAKPADIRQVSRKQRNPKQSKKETCPIELDDFETAEQTPDSVTLEMVSTDVVVLLYPANYEFIMSMTKAKINIIPASYVNKDLKMVNEEKPSSITKIAGLLSNNQAKSPFLKPELSSLEYLVYKGAEPLLKRYFLKALKPKNKPDEAQTKRWVLLAMMSGNVPTLQLVLDEIVQASTKELKELLTKYQMLSYLAGKTTDVSYRQFFITRVKPLGFTIPEIKNDLFNLDDVEGLEQLPVQLFKKQFSLSYHEIFNVYMKEAVGNKQEDYVKLLEEVFNTDLPLEYLASDSSEDNDDLDGNKNVDSQVIKLSVFSTSLYLNFHDTIPTAIHNDLKLTFGQTTNKQKEFVFDRPHKQQFKIGNMSQKEVELYLKEDHIKYSNLRSYMVRLCNSLGDKGPYAETYLTLLPLLRFDQRILKELFSLDVGKVLHVFTKVMSPRLTAEDCLVEDTEKFIAATLLHNFDQQLGYGVSAERFLASNSAFQQTTFFKAVWKNQEFITAFKAYMSLFFKKKPKIERLDINVFGQKLMESKASNILLLAEYIAMNEPQVFLKIKGLNLMFASQKLLMIVVRSLCDIEKDNEGLLTEFINVVHDALQAGPSEQQQQIMHNALRAVQMVSMQKFNKNVTSIIDQEENMSLMDRSMIYWKLMNDLVNNESLNLLVDSRKAQGDMKKDILQEPEFLQEVIMKIIEDRTQTKTDFPEDLLKQLTKFSAKPCYPVQNDKIYKGFALFKVLLDLVHELEVLEEQVRETYPQLEDLEFSVELLSNEQTQKYQCSQIKPVLKKGEKANEFIVKFKIPLTIVRVDSKKPIQCYPNLIIHPAMRKQVEVLIQKHLKEVYYVREITTWNASADIREAVGLVRVEVKDLTPENARYLLDGYQLIHNGAPNPFDFPRLLSERVRPLKAGINLLKPWFDDYESTRLDLDDYPKGAYKPRFRKSPVESNMDLEQQFIEFFPEFTDYKWDIQVKYCSQGDFLNKQKVTEQLKLFMGEYYAQASICQQFCGQFKNYKSWEDAAELNYSKLKLVRDRKIEWPVIGNALSNAAQGSENCLPYGIYSQLRRRIKISFGFYTNMLSVIDVLVYKVASILEKSTKSTKPMNILEVIDLSTGWYTLNYITGQINEMFETHGIYSQVKRVYLEFSEIEASRCYNGKGLSTLLEGLDQMFRMGPTTYLIHNGILVVRLGIAQIREDTVPFDVSQWKHPVYKNRTSPTILSTPIMMENEDARSYINSIVNEESFFKQTGLNPNEEYQEQKAAASRPKPKIGKVSLLDEKNFKPRRFRATTRKQKKKGGKKRKADVKKPVLPIKQQQFQNDDDEYDNFASSKLKKPQNESDSRAKPQALSLQANQPRADTRKTNQPDIRSRDDRPAPRDERAVVPNDQAPARNDQAPTLVRRAPADEKPKLASVEKAKLKVNDDLGDDRKSKQSLQQQGRKDDDNLKKIINDKPAEQSDEELLDFGEDGQDLAEDKDEPQNVDNNVKQNDLEKHADDGPVAGEDQEYEEEEFDGENEDGPIAKAPAKQNDFDRRADDQGPFVQAQGEQEDQNDLQARGVDDGNLQVQGEQEDIDNLQARGVDDGDQFVQAQGIQEDQKDGLDDQQNDLQLQGEDPKVGLDNQQNDLQLQGEVEG